ncbi:MAG: zinc-ribbon domain-containing protein [Planctomycetales bacterium]
MQCEGCDKRYRIRDEQAGRKLKCKQCGSTITVPHSL